MVHKLDWGYGFISAKSAEGYRVDVPGVQVIGGKEKILLCANFHKAKGLKNGGKEPQYKIEGRNLDGRKVTILGTKSELEKLARRMSGKK